MIKLPMTKLANVSMLKPVFDKLHSLSKISQRRNQILKNNSSVSVAWSMPHSLFAVFIMKLHMYTRKKIYMWVGIRWVGYLGSK